jgi:hypothetical protein
MQVSSVHQQGAQHSARAHTNTDLTYALQAYGAYTTCTVTLHQNLIHPPPAHHPHLTHTP